MKKNYLAVFILGFMTVSASDYNVLIKKHEYEVIESYERVIETGEWENISSEECTFDFLASDYYYDQSFLQNEICTQEQSQEVIYKNVYADGSSEIVKTEINYQTIESKNVTNQAYGTHISEDCNAALNFDNTLLSGLYMISPTGNNISATCDMITDGGGWTLVSIVTASSNVVETNSYIDNLTVSNSMAKHYFNNINPASILFQSDDSNNEANGGGDFIKITRTGSSWGFNVGDYNNNTGQLGYIKYKESSSWSSLGVMTYASHREEPWQSATFSFTSSGMQNGYSGSYTDRIILGPTFLSSSSGKWYNFKGNSTSNVGSWAGDGKVWMR